MNENKYLEFIKGILQNELSIDISGLYLDQVIREAGIDSIALMALIVYLENEFGATLDQLFVNYDHDLTFRNIYDTIRNETEKQG